MTTLLDLGELTLPLDVVTRTTGIVGQRGTGKTSTAVVLVEEAHDAGAPFVVIDPTGAWYGIRSSADGQHAGLDVVVMGGHHGDLPLGEHGGEYVARLVIEQRVSLVLDLELLTKGQQVRFVAEFAEALYHGNREALLVVVDEAHRFAPQQLRDPGGYGARCLGALSDLVTLGRRKGLGAALISQRPAKISKDVLEQAEVMIAHRLMGPNDRKALKDWMEEAEADDGPTMDVLPKLDRGQAVVWAPAFDVHGVFVIRPKRTYDSSATPEVGETIIDPSGRPELDLEAIREAMAEAIEDAEADDPKALRSQITDLRRQLADAEPAGLADDDRTLLHVTYVIAEQRLQHVHGAVGVALDALYDLRALLAELDVGNLEDSGEDRRTDEPEPAAMGGAPTVERPPQAPAPAGVGEADDGDPTAALTFGAARVFRALSERHPLRFTRAQVATLSKYSVKGGAFAGALAELRQAGLLVEEGGLFGVPVEHLSGARCAPTTEEQALDMWRGVLDAGPRKVFDALSRNGGMSRERLAAVVGMSPRGGAFAGHLAVLRKNGLIWQDGRKSLRLTAKATETV